MEVKDGRALVAAFRTMEPSSDVDTFARKLGGGVLSVIDAQTFFPEKFLNDEVGLVSGEKSTETRPYFVVDAKTFKRYSPGWLYLRRLLKQFILAAENDGEEVLDNLYEPHAIYLLPSQEGPEIPLRRYKSFSYRMPAKARAHLALKTRAMKESEDSGGCWGRNGWH